jgi:hypothetical protein
MEAPMTHVHTQTGGTVGPATPLATMQTLARYWATEYDWRKGEAKLNALPTVHQSLESEVPNVCFIHPGKPSLSFEGGRRGRPLGGASVLRARRDGNHFGRHDRGRDYGR